MKHLIKAFMAIGFIAILLGAGAMDNTSIIVPICVTFTGIGMIALGGYLDSYYEWYEERKNR